MAKRKKEQRDFADRLKVLEARLWDIHACQVHLCAVLGCSPCDVSQEKEKPGKRPR
ncbi:MAG: hypothetical protein HZA50_11805 [Planctomycetes bacterium]|nr:hypothetical protein [Planctomycetota bacterium]